MTLRYQLNEINTIAEAVLAAINKMGCSVVCFNAPMGSGKTTLINAICTTMGVESNTSSPSFSIVNEYLTKNGKKIYHADLYRVKDAEELLDIGFEDILYSGHWCFIEWPEITKPILPKHYIEVQFWVEDKETRTITLLKQ
jgi:tRNA threonylcarbamoyladenosine biosynthesis protein TsaE